MGGVLYAEEGEERAAIVMPAPPRPQGPMAASRPTLYSEPAVERRCGDGRSGLALLPLLRHHDAPGTHEASTSSGQRTAAVPSDSDSQSTHLQQLRQTRMAAPGLALPRITPPSTYSIATTCADPWPTRNHHLGPSHRPMPSHRRH